MAEGLVSLLVMCLSGSYIADIKYSSCSNALTSENRYIGIMVSMDISIEIYGYMFL